MRRVPPPDFRYVWLSPGASSATAALGGATFVMSGLGALLWTAGFHGLAAGPLVAAGVMAAGSLLGGRRVRLFGRGRGREVAMAIVPWGVVVEPETEPHVLRWPAIKGVTVDVDHTMRAGTPEVVASVVTVRTAREELTGRTPGAAGLEALVVNFAGYAAECCRPVALDLGGHEPAEGGDAEPVVGALLQAADALCSSGRGAAELGLPVGGYRSIARAVAGPETLSILRRALTEASTGPADARPLAALTAGLLGAVELIPELVKLVSSPHPVVAATAKAAALRLGAPRNRAGALDEVAPFLLDDDLVAVARFAEGA